MSEPKREPVMSTGWHLIPGREYNLALSCVLKGGQMGTQDDSFVATAASLTVFLPSVGRPCAQAGEAQRTHRQVAPWIASRDVTQSPCVVEQPTVGGPRGPPPFEEGSLCRV